jgi:ribosomal protein L20
MKAIITTAALILAMTTSMGAAADRDDRRYERNVRQYAEHDYKHDRRRHKRRGHRDERVTRIHVPLRIHGSENIRLSKILAYHYGIDSNQYKLKRVVLHNGASYPKSRARVYVGHASSGHYLREGENPIAAPYGHGRWTVRVKHAHLSGMTVVMERKKHYAYRDRPAHRRYQRTVWGARCGSEKRG